MWEGDRVVTIRIEHPGGVATDDLVKHEISTPAPDGVETVFITANAYVSGTLEVYRDQSVLLKGIAQDFTETSSTTFTVTSPPDADEVLWVCYVKA